MLLCASAHADPSASALDACDGSDFQACFDEAQKLLHGTDGRRQHRLGAYVLDRWLCGNWFRPACEAMRTLPGDLSDEAQLTIPYWLQSCKRGNATDCYAVALSTNLGLRHKSDPKWAPLYERACAGGEVRACARVGFLMREGQLAGDAARELALDRRTCERLHINCGTVAEAMLAAPDGATHRDEARRLVEADCDGHHPLGCFSLALLFQRGRVGDKPDLVAAGQAYARACKLGHGPSCNEWGELRRKGALGVVERPLAIDAWKLGCEQSDLTSCVRVADDDQANGRYAEAYHAYDRLCKMGRADACNNFGACIMARRCTGENTQALELYRRACDGKDRVGCRNLGKSLQQPWSGETDANRAWDAFRRSCELGDAVACRTIAEQYARVGNDGDSRAAFERACSLDVRFCSSRNAPDAGAP